MLKKQAHVLDNWFSINKFLNGNNFSLADIFVGSVMIPCFQLIFDPDFRQHVPNLTKWFDTFCLDPFVQKRYGLVYPCHVALLPLGVKPKQSAKPAPVKKEAELFNAEEELDLFGDHNEADEQAAKEIAAGAAKKKKKVVVAKSLVLFDVKPLESETDLDVMASRILELTGEGIHWKTEYKKEPVAFGIFKLVIGVTVEDEKVSVDGLVERIEALDDMVQSVEIVAFNKV